MGELLGVSAQVSWLLRYCQGGNDRAHIVINIINFHQTLKVFENTGIQIDTDLPAMAKCELLTDAVNIEEPDYDDYEVAHSLGGKKSIQVSSSLPTPWKDYSDFATRGGGRPVPLAAAVAAEDDEIYYEEELALKETFDEGPTKPSLELRSDFPENWLFYFESSESSTYER